MTDRRRSPRGAVQSGAATADARPSYACVVARAPLRPGTTPASDGGVRGSEASEDCAAAAPGTRTRRRGKRGGKRHSKRRPPDATEPGRRPDRGVPSVGGSADAGTRLDEHGDAMRRWIDEADAEQHGWADETDAEQHGWADAADAAHRASFAADDKDEDEDVVPLDGPVRCDSPMTVSAAGDAATASEGSADRPWSHGKGRCEQCDERRDAEDALDAQTALRYQRQEAVRDTFRLLVCAVEGRGRRLDAVTAGAGTETACATDGPPTAAAHIVERVADAAADACAEPHTAAATRLLGEPPLCAEPVRACTVAGPRGVLYAVATYATRAPLGAERRDPGRRRGRRRWWATCTAWERGSLAERYSGPECAAVSFHRRAVEAAWRLDVERLQWLDDEGTTAILSVPGRAPAADGSGTGGGGGGGGDGRRVWYALHTGKDPCAEPRRPNGPGAWRTVLYELERAQPPRWHRFTIDAYDDARLALLMHDSHLHTLATRGHLALRDGTPLVLESPFAAPPVAPLVVAVGDDGSALCGGGDVGGRRAPSDGNVDGDAYDEDAARAAWIAAGQHDDYVTDGGGGGCGDGGLSAPYGSPYVLYDSPIPNPGDRYGMPYGDPCGADGLWTWPYAGGPWTYPCHDGSMATGPAAAYQAAAGPFGADCVYAPMAPHTQAAPTDWKGRVLHA